ncbi:hypothetical protein CEP81_11930 [Kocuria rhizophila]|nr:hypothetical protein CEP81_11930 [Kocuria rhizophila]HAG62735.1 hypothetical protein [Kocuria sp.]
MGHPQLRAAGPVRGARARAEHPPQREVSPRPPRPPRRPRRTERHPNPTPDPARGQPRRS